MVMPVRLFDFPEISATNHYSRDWKKNENNSEEKKKTVKIGQEIGQNKQFSGQRREKSRKTKVRL